VFMRRTVERPEGVRLADVLNAQQLKGTLEVSHPKYYEISLDSGGRVVIRDTRNSSLHSGEVPQFSNTSIECSIHELSDASDRVGITISRVGPEVLDLHGVAVPTDAEREEMRETSCVLSPYVSSNWPQW